MKTLPRVRATAEQLPLISQNRLGVEVICGAAGSGKTSTALLRLRSLCFMFAARRARLQDPRPIRVLVLTFNRTLAGYVRSLAESQLDDGIAIELEIETFARWAMLSLGRPNVDERQAKAERRRLSANFGALTPDYIMKEVDYILGRFDSEDLERYIQVERTGRGPLPRVDRAVRRRILDEIVYPYLDWLRNNNIIDWNKLSVDMKSAINSKNYDIIIVDESQDFSANQLRAIRHHLASEHSVTFVIDTMQRIYARGFTWMEAGFDVRPERVHVLRANHRNTVEIATFAAGILQGIGVDSDGALPNLAGAASHGPIPTVLAGRYSAQSDWSLNYIINNVDLRNDSVAFLKPKAGVWFDVISDKLRARRLGFADITRAAEWPEGPENIALSTFHSAKGLEFDYVFIIGFNAENTPHPDAELDDEVFVLRKLLAVAVARARKEVFLGYKPGEESQLTRYFSPATFRILSL